MTHPRRQQLRYTLRSVGLAAAAASLALLAALAALSGRGIAAVTAGAACGIALLGANHCRQRAVRNRIGADAEHDVARALDALARHRGWKVKHGVRWQGRGDIDHVAVAPGGQRFVIETKTLRYAPEHLDRVRTAARALRAVPVLCIARGRRAHRTEADVLIVSLDRLANELARRASPGRA
jgi:nuclease-like protein